MKHRDRIVWAALLGAILVSAGCATANSRGGHTAIADPAQPDKVTTFLMFEGDAEAAMGFYTSLFADSEIIAIDRYGPEGPGAEGSVVHATFTLAGRSFMAIDSPGAHPFTFTPSVSLFVTCATEAELVRLFATLSEGGQVLMPLDAYGFSRRFGWVTDRFGVSWQLHLGFE